ncbi:MAG: spore maturation protein [Clostridia bacterium]|jgi:spore maturation protein B|nr:spore maturation protein [Clostridia bacterium]
MMNFSDFILPTIVTLIIIFGAIKGLNVFDTFLDGAKSGFKTVLSITPPLIGLIVAVNMLKNSGGLDIITDFLSPLASFLKIPKEVTPLMILSPISGSGSLSIFESILKDYGPDSFIGRTASVMMGSTETTFYATTLYYGSCNIKKTRHTLPCAICADITSFIFSARAVSLFLQN